MGVAACLRPGIPWYAWSSHCILQPGWPQAMMLLALAHRSPRSFNLDWSLSLYMPTCFSKTAPTKMKGSLTQPQFWETSTMIFPCMTLLLSKTAPRSIASKSYGSSRTKAPHISKAPSTAQPQSSQSSQSSQSQSNSKSAHHGVWQGCCVQSSEAGVEGRTEPAELKVWWRSLSLAYAEAVAIQSLGW